MRIPEKHLAREIERIANAGIRSVMTFGISHHTDETGSDAWREDGLVARMSRICKQTVPEMIVMSDTCFCEYTSHGHCGVLCEHGVDNDATLEKFRQASRGCSCCRRRFHRPFRCDGWSGTGDSPGRWTLRALKIRRLCRIRPSSPPPFMARSVKLPEAH